MQTPYVYAFPDSDKGEFQYLVKMLEVEKTITEDVLYYMENHDMYTPSQLHDLYIDETIKSYDPEPSRKKPLNNYYMQNLYEDCKSETAEELYELLLCDELNHFEITPAKWKLEMDTTHSLLHSLGDKSKYDYSMLKKYLDGEIS